MFILHQVEFEDSGLHDALRCESKDAPTLGDYEARFRAMFETAELARLGSEAAKQSPSADPLPYLGNGAPRAEPKHGGEKIPQEAARRGSDSKK